MISSGSNFPILLRKQPTLHYTMIITRLPSSIKEKVEAYLNLTTCKNKYTYVHQRYCRSRSSKKPLHLHQSVQRLPSPTVHLVISSQFINRFPYVHHHSPLCTNTIYEISIKTLLSQSQNLYATRRLENCSVLSYTSSTLARRTSVK